MDEIIKITCNCKQKYKIIHFLSYTKEIDYFVYESSEIYIENKKDIRPYKEQTEQKRVRKTNKHEVEKQKQHRVHK